MVKGAVPSCTKTVRCNSIPKSHRTSPAGKKKSRRSKRIAFNKTVCLATKGDAEANLKLGVHYHLHGVDNKPDPRLAIKYFKLAREASGKGPVYDDATFCLGSMLYMGDDEHGISSDICIGTNLIEEAARNGHQKALYMLQSVMFRM